MSVYTFIFQFWTLEFQKEKSLLNLFALDKNVLMFASAGSALLKYPCEMNSGYQK